MAAFATYRQVELLRAIRALTKARGFPPTLLELSAHLGMKAAGGAASGLWALRKKGMLTMLPRVARSMVITDKGHAELAEADVLEAQDSVGRSGIAPACEADGIRSNT